MHNLNAKVFKMFAAASLSVILTLPASGCAKSQDLVLSGTVEAEQLNISSEAAGKVVKIEKEEGSQVKKDDVIAVLDSSLQELAVKQQDALVKLKQARLDEIKTSAKPEQIQQAELDLEQSKLALEQSKLLLSRYQIKSPSDGVLLYRNVNAGDMVNTGASIGSVSIPDNLWVRLYIPQKNLNLVSLNQEITLKSAALPGKTIKGVITYIAGEAEFTPKNTETNEAKENTVFKIKVKLMDNLDALKPGMTIDANIPLGGR